MRLNDPRVYLLICTVLFIIESCVYNTAEAYTHRQVQALQLARSVGELYNFPETMQGIVLQESSGCTKKLGDDGQSLGCAHVTVPAALDVFRWCTTHRTECSVLDYAYKDKQQLRVDLATNDSLNIVIAALYFKLNFDWFKTKKYSHPWTRAVVAYNSGRFRASVTDIDSLTQHDYFIKIRNRISKLRKFKSTSKIWI